MDFFYIIITILFIITIINIITNAWVLHKTNYKDENTKIYIMQIISLVISILMFIVSLIIFFGINLKN